MPAGIQVWDDTGVMVIDISDRLARTLASFNVFSGPGNIAAPGISTGTPWAYVASTSTSANGLPVVSFDTVNERIIWTNAAQPCKITYGVY